MGMGGGGSSPQTVNPGQAAQAAVGAASAGEKMSVANQPVEQYANLATTTQLGPAEQQTQSALQNQAALQSAQAQMDIQSRVDPMAYQQRNMRLAQANNRIAQLTGYDPTAFSASYPGAYQVGNMQNLANLGALAQQGQQIAAYTSGGSVNKAGGNPQLVTPGNTQNVNVLPTQSYLA